MQNEQTYKVHVKKKNQLTNNLILYMFQKQELILDMTNL